MDCVRPMSSCSGGESILPPGAYAMRCVSFAKRSEVGGRNQRACAHTFAASTEYSARPEPVSLSTPVQAVTKRWSVPAHLHSRVDLLEAPVQRGSALGQLPLGCRVQLSRRLQLLHLFRPAAGLRAQWHGLNPVGALQGSVRRVAQLRRMPRLPACRSVGATLPARMAGTCIL